LYRCTCIPAHLGEEEKVVVDTAGKAAEEEVGDIQERACVQEEDRPYAVNAIIVQHTTACDNKCHREKSMSWSFSTP
jgi:hypothetical protein